MIDLATAAFRQIFTPPFRAVTIKSVALTLGVLALVWIAVTSGVGHLVALQNWWLDTAVSVLTGLGLFIGLAFLIAPVTALVAGLFLDDVAERVEREIDPEGPPGRPVPAGRAIWLAARFAGVSALVNLAALLLLFVPGVNLIAFFAANAYLAGREYFELAAMRYRPVEEARALRARHAARLFLYGLPIAAMMAVPVLNLFTPLFGTAFMVRVHRRLAPLPAPAEPASQALARSN